nr:MAG TPA: hypothetical protein [Caudoviricetes sp.]
MSNNFPILPKFLGKNLGHFNTINKHKKNGRTISVLPFYYFVSVGVILFVLTSFSILEEIYSLRSPTAEFKYSIAS